MKKTIPLPEQALLLALLRYEPDTGKLFWRPRTVSLFQGGKYDGERRCRRWNSRYADQEAFTTINGNGYKIGSIAGRTYQAHRVIWKMVHGVDPEEVDHQNQVGTSNEIGNLRDVSAAVNCRNKAASSKNKSGRVGVYQRGARWAAQIKVDQRVKHLGSFDTIEQAAAARSLAERSHGFTSEHGAVR